MTTFISQLSLKILKSNSLGFLVASNYIGSYSSVWQKDLLTKLTLIPSFKIQQKCIKMLLKPVYYNGGIIFLLSLVLIEEARIKNVYAEN